MLNKYPNQAQFIDEVIYKKQRMYGISSCKNPRTIARVLARRDGSWKVTQRATHEAGSGVCLRCQVPGLPLGSYSARVLKCWLMWDTLSSTEPSAYTALICAGYSSTL